MSGKSLGGFNSSVSWLEDELLPEITLLDVTCESPLPGSEPATPATSGSVNIRFTPRHPSTHKNTSAWKASPQRKTLDLLQSNVSTHKSESETCHVKSSLQNDTKTEMNTSDKENYSEVHSPEHNGTASTDSKDNMFYPPKSMYAPVNWLDVRYIPEITLLDVTHDSELSQGGEVSSTDKNNSFLEKSKPSGPNMKTQSAEDTLSTRPANLTHDMSSSSDLSVQSAISQVSTFDTQCNTSSKNGTSELHGDPVVTSNTVEADNDDPPTNHDAKSTSKEPQPTPNTSGSVNVTFTSLQPSQLSSSTDSNNTAQITCSQNTTLDLPSHASTAKEESEATDQAVSKNTTETSLVVNQNSSVKANDSCDMPNATFDKHSLQKSSTGTVLEDAGAVTPCHQNNTFDAKPLPKHNGTINLSETSDSPQSTFDRLSPLKACNATSSPKENSSENHHVELLKNNGAPASADTAVNVVDAPESTFEVNPAVEVASADTKDHSQSCLPLTDGLSDSLDHQNTDVDNNKANTFNLDETLDLRADSLITSTPLTNCKVLNLNTQREDGKITLAQKQLYRDGLCKPGGQLSSDVPSNIVSDRKTFLTHAAHKFIVPPSKPASQLLKHKPASAIPGRLEALASGLPVTRQRTQGEALRNSAAPDAPQTTGISSSYNLRSSTTGSKQSSSGLQRPQLSGIPSGIQRAATGLRLPSVRSNTLATSKLCGPTATNPVVKTSQAKKHPLTRGEALPIAKRKKMDPPSLGSAEASRTSCDATNGAKNLKQPTTSKRALPAKSQRDEAAVPATTAAEVSTSCDAVSRARALKQPAASHRAVLAKPKGNGCVNCVMFEHQLKLKTEEIRRLKEELLRKSKQEEEC